MNDEDWEDEEVEGFLNWIQFSFFWDETRLLIQTRAASSVGNLK